LEKTLNNKERNIDRLYKARAAHIRWMNSVKLLISGLTIKDKVPSPIIQESYFGKWYYDEALQFAKFNSNQVLNEIEDLMESIYNQYTQIYLIYFGKKSSMIQSIFGVKHSASKYELELASNYYEETIVLSDKLKKKLATLERQLFALSLEQHDKVKVFEEETTSLSEPSLLNRTDTKSYKYGARSY